MGNPPPTGSGRERQVLLVVVATMTIAAILIVAAAVGLLIRAEFGPKNNVTSPTRCSKPGNRPIELPPDLFVSNSSGPLIDPAGAYRVVSHFWPIEETALANDDQATTDLIESGPAAEYASAITCEDVILGVHSLRTVRPANAIQVYVSRQNVYPITFFAQVQTTVYTRDALFVEYLVFVKVDAQSAWKVVIDTGYTGDLIPLPPTLERPFPATGETFDAPPPRPDWIDPHTVPQALASYWQHWVMTGNPPPDNHFSSGYWTTTHGADLKSGHQIELARGIVDQTQYFVDLVRDGAYQFGVSYGVDLECFAVRYTATLTAAHLGGRLHQNSRREQYTVLLPPGTYSTIIENGLHQSCALIPPVTHRAINGFPENGIGIVGGQGSDTRLTGIP